MKIKKNIGPNEIKKRLVILGLIAVLLCGTVLSNLVSASEFDWSDNFDDGNYDGWTVIQGGFGVTDGVLVGTANGPGDASCSIYHESNVSMGTWSFGPRTTRPALRNSSTRRASPKAWGTWGLSVDQAGLCPPT